MAKNTDANIVNLKTLKNKMIIYNCVIDRNEKNKYKEYYYVENYVYIDDSNYDIFVQKCWGNYELTQFSEKTFVPRRYKFITEKDGDEYDDIIKLLEDADVVKEETDDIILRTKKNSDQNDFKAQYKNKWIPLKLHQACTIKYGDKANLNTGVRIEVPKKTEAILLLKNSMYKDFGIVQERPVILNNDKSKDKVWTIPVILLNPDFVEYRSINEYITLYHGERVVRDTHIERFDKSVTIPKGTEIGMFRIVKVNTNLKFKDRLKSIDTDAEYDEEVETTTEEVIAQENAARQEEIEAWEEENGESYDPNDNVEDDDSDEYL